MAKSIWVLDDQQSVHVLFDQHEILVTEGLNSESFHPGYFSVNGIDTAARAELFEIFPELRNNLSGYGAAARPVLSVQNGRALRNVA